MKQTVYKAFSIFLFFIPVQINAQDTLLRKLDSLEITAARTPGFVSGKRYSEGSKISRFNIQSDSRLQSSSLADFIKSESALYVKESGKNAGSYLSVRGTSSSHTKITWNDIDISFPTMGIADFSLVPVYFIDRLEIHSGAAASANGEGSIGGALRLTSTPAWANGLHGNILLSAGSYNAFFKGATIRYGQNYFESRTSFYHEIARNNFTFRNNTLPGYPRERLNNTQTLGYGFLQEISKRTGKESMLSLSVMALDHDRQIQPTVSNNSSPSTYASIADISVKALVKYFFKRGKFAHSIKSSFSWDRQIFKQDTIAAGRISASYETEFTSNQLAVKGGVSGEYTNPEVYSYDPETHESRASLYILAAWTPASRLTISGGLRYLDITGIDIPLMPSFDAKYKLLTNARNNLCVRASTSKNVKAPSLNDRYWGGNNLYLKPEYSLTMEVGADYSHISEKIKADSWITLYKSSVNDWIRWLPAGSVWRPQNIPRVNSAGIEAGLKLTTRAGRLTNTLDLNYTYTSIKMVKSLMQNDPSVGHQLAYQPHSILNAKITTSIADFTIFLSSLYTGRRTTVDIYDQMPSYLVFDAGASKKFEAWGYRWDLSATIMNLSDKQYQNVKFYAMPGINFRFALQWNF